MILETTAGQWLRVLREAAGRTQEDQAQMLNELSGRPGVLDRFDISRWERNVRLPVPYWQQYIAVSFGIAEADLAQLVRATRAERRRRAKQSDPYTAGT